MTPSHDDKSGAGLSGPPYPQQPRDAERPVPLRGRPERTQDPDEWDSSALPEEPVRDSQEGEGFAQRAGDERRAQADGGADERRAEHDDAESGYSTEQQQGAAQPGPDV